MLELWIERPDINVELLDAQLRAIGAGSFYGLSAQRGGVILYMNDSTPVDLQKSLARVAQQHDAAQMTPKQEAQAARQSRLEEERTNLPLDEKHYEGSPALIKAMAAKIAWLEQEVRDLRGVE